jgi:hypothetical protein
VTIYVAGPPWTDTGAFWIALAAALLSAGALAVSIWSAISGTRSARYANTSAEAAKRSADSADTSAKAAEKSAEADGKVAQVELDRDHETYRPAPLGGEFYREPSHAHPGRERIVFEFTLPRAYRAGGTLLYQGTGQGYLGLDPGPIIQAGHVNRIEVGHTGMNIPKIVRLHFWPPAADDPGETWTCRCGRAPIQDGNIAHWVWNVLVPERLDNLPIRRTVVSPSPDAP